MEEKVIKRFDLHDVKIKLIQEILSDDSKAYCIDLIPEDNLERTVRIDCEDYVDAVFVFDTIVDKACSIFLK